MLKNRTVLQSDTLNGQTFVFDFSRHKKNPTDFLKKAAKKGETNLIANLFDFNEKQ